MSKTSKIIVPQENVSDDSYTVIEHIFKNGDKISKNQNPNRDICRPKK